jgi:cell division protein ZapA (FtsZ GTPase activity inhibitor)
MNKLLATQLAVAVSAAFVITVNLSACSTTPKKEIASAQQNLTPEEAAIAEAEKKKADKKKRERELRNSNTPSGGCGH